MVFNIVGAHVEKTLCQTAVNYLRNVSNRQISVSCYLSYWDDEDEKFMSKRPMRSDNNFNTQNQRQRSSYRDNDRFDRQYSDDEQNNDYDHFPRRSHTQFRSDRSFAGAGLARPNWESVNLGSVKKDFYVRSEAVENQSEEQVRQFRTSNNIFLKGHDVPKPILNFADYEFPDQIQRSINEMKFDSPTPIQSQSWPIALSGKDFVGIGQTGSGKTLGYAIPGLIHTDHHRSDHDGDGPVGLVLAPTRELVQQINNVVYPMARHLTLQTASVFGGASRNVQARNIRGASIVIATPGRLLDFLESRVARLNRCSYLVLDEADRMLDMGFEPQIRKIIDQTRPDRQTLMWSATWPKDVKGLAEDFLTDYIQLNVGSTELRANPDVKQTIEVIDRMDKRRRIHTLMKEETSDPDAKVLIFCSTKRAVDNLIRDLRRSLSEDVAGIHGDYSQQERDRSLRSFRDGRSKVLIATDVAARGLDVNDISLVVNYDFPNSIEDYVHRIGRTARAGKAGKSHSFFDAMSSSMANDLVKVLQDAGQDVPEELGGLSYSRSGGRPQVNRYRSRRY